MTPDQLALFVMESSTNRRKTAIEAGLVKTLRPARRGCCASSSAADSSAITSTRRLP
jgi:hypothetical protein